jgi:uncharacterized protein YgiM (DUF1202 family)
MNVLKIQHTDTRRCFLTKVVGGGTIALGAAMFAGGLPGSVAVKSGDAARPVSRVMTTTTTVNLRSRPSLKGKVLAIVPEGSKVIVKGSESVNGFLPVIYNRIDGWIYAAYLE